MAVSAHACANTLALAALCVGLGCATTPLAPAKPAPVMPAPPRADAPAEQEPEEEDDGLDPEVVRAETRKILAEVARARNLEVTWDVQVDVVDREGVRDFAKKALYEHATPEEILLLGRVESSLGVIPVGADAEQVLLDLLEMGVLGLYDPKRKILLIGDYVPRTVLSTVVGHEIVHGLQDMHFGLERMQEPMRHRSDADSARRFLVEGDAQAAYLAWVSGERGLFAIDDEVFQAMGNQVLELAAVSAYPILARDLQLPYAEGAATIARLVKRRGWKAVNELYDNPPDTSEQMLHIDKLLRREPAIAVTLDAEVLLKELPGYKSVWHDTLGEASLLAMLAEVEPSIVARRAAAGWGGDHYVALDRVGDPLPAPIVVGVIVWDSKRDAGEFEDSLRRYLEEQMPGAYLLERKRDRVLFATRLPEGMAPDQIAGPAWRAVRVKRGKGKHTP
jgi:hypothetical protein